MVQTFSLYALVGVDEQSTSTGRKQKNGVAVMVTPGGENISLVGSGKNFLRQGVCVGEIPAVLVFVRFHKFNVFVEDCQLDVE